MAGIKITAQIEKLRELRDKFKAFPNDVSSKLLADALKKAIEPAYQHLKSNAPAGPTGNLRRSVNKKVKTYVKDGAAVGLVGFNRSGKAGSDSAAGGSVGSGKDRAFHQHFVEFGTKQRRVDKFSNKPYQRKSKKGLVHWVSGQNSYIASSFNRLGPFRMVRRQDGEIQTDPSYQKAFFKKSRNPILLKPMPRGGNSGQAPIEAAFNATQGEMARILQDELSTSMERALESITQFMQGTVSGG
jgi:HK97 gp10 family phage protein